MDLSALPARSLLRWDLAVRIGLAVSVPIAVEMWRTGGATAASIVCALVAGLISLASLGPEMTQPRWVAVAAIGTPVALAVGSAVGPSAAGGVLWVFLLYACQGALTEVGLVSQMAWFPVAMAGLVASVLTTGATPLGEIAAAGVLGAVWAVLLMLAVPRVLPAPRIPIPPGALAVDTEKLRRMVTHPTLAAWVFPLMLGGLASALLIIVDSLTGGFRPFWAVFALAGVLSPTAAATRRSTWETVGSTLGGILLAALLLASSLPVLTIAGVALVAALVGATLLLRNGLVSKLLMTPLPVVMAAASLGPDQYLAVGMRLVEYLIGAGVGFVAAVAAEWLSLRLEEDRPAEQSDLVG